MATSTDLPQSIIKKLQLSRFLDGNLVIWTNKNIMTPTEGKPAYMTCAACASDYKWPRCERVLTHVVGDRHQQNCQEKLDAAEKELRKGLMENSCSSVASKCRSSSMCIIII